MKKSAVSALDVAHYILEKSGTMSAMKLQKLVYYCQAWSLVWDDQRLFVEPIEAWSNGPVIPKLYERHRGLFEVSPKDVGGDPKRLGEEDIETIDAVLDYYGPWNAQQLSDRTHAEEPWKRAREGVPSGKRATNLITLESMGEYYGNLPPDVELEAD